MPRDAVSRSANVGTWLRKRNGSRIIIIYVCIFIVYYIYYLLPGTGLFKVIYFKWLKKLSVSKITRRRLLPSRRPRVETTSVEIKKILQQPKKSPPYLMLILKQAPSNAGVFLALGFFPAALFPFKSFHHYLGLFHAN